MPIAGKYRLIDIPISNCINSELNRIYVLTQFNSVSLHRHIANTYKFDPFGGGFVEILAAQQTMQHESWYQGTADAVRRNIPYFSEAVYDLVLILSGDQLYRMDFQDMIRTHLETKADVTIAALPVGEEEAQSCGIMRIDDTGRVIDFEEKPKTPEKLDRVRTDPEVDGAAASRPRAAPTWRAWASTCSTATTLVAAARRGRRAPTSARRSSPRRSPSTASRRTCSTATGRTSGPSAPSTRRTST